MESLSRRLLSILFVGIVGILFLGATGCRFVTGKVTGNQGCPISNTKLTWECEGTFLTATTRANGNYSASIPSSISDGTRCELESVTKGERALPVPDIENISFNVMAGTVTRDISAGKDCLGVVVFACADAGREDCDIGLTDAFLLPVIPALQSMYDSLYLVKNQATSDPQNLVNALREANADNAKYDLVITAHGLVRRFYGGAHIYDVDFVDDHSAHMTNLRVVYQTNCFASGRFPDCPTLTEDPSKPDQDTCQSLTEAWVYRTGAEVALGAQVVNSNPDLLYLHQGFGVLTHVLTFENYWQSGYDVFEANQSADAAQQAVEGSDNSAKTIVGNEELTIDSYIYP